MKTDFCKNIFLYIFEEIKAIQVQHFKRETRHASITFPRMNSKSSFQNHYPVKSCKPHTSTPVLPWASDPLRMRVCVWVSVTVTFCAALLNCFYNTIKPKLTNYRSPRRVSFIHTFGKYLDEIRVRDARRGTPNEEIKLSISSIRTN